MSIRSGGSVKKEAWLHTADNLQIVDETNSLVVLEKGKCNGYGRSAVGAGRAEWKVRIDFESFGGITVGLWRHDLRQKSELEGLPLEDAFTDFANGYGFNSKTAMLIHNKEKRRYGRRWKRGDELTMSLDLTSRCLSFAINGEDQGLAFDALPTGAYRLACKLQFPDQKLSTLEFWTSLEDIHVTEIMVALPPSDSGSAASHPISSDYPTDIEVTSFGDEAAADAAVAEDSDEEEEEYEEESDEKGQSDGSEPAAIYGADDDVFAKEDLDDAEDQTAEDDLSKVERSYSMGEMRDEIGYQRKSSVTSSPGSLEELEAAETPSRPFAIGAGPPPVEVPEHVEISQKEEEGDFFAHCGSNMAVEDSKVTCTRDSKTRCSAFGAQVVTTGRMDWMIKLDKGHSVRVGVSGITSNTDSDFSAGSFGYAYGDDGNIYFSGSMIEFGDGFNAGDVVGVFLDMDRGRLRFTVNGEDHGDAFEELKLSEDDGVFGYRLAVSMMHRPHAVSMIESTIWNTKQYSPRPKPASVSHGRRKSATDMFPFGEDEKTEAPDEDCAKGKKAKGKKKKKKPSAAGESAKKKKGVRKTSTGKKGATESGSKKRTTSKTSIAASSKRTGAGSKKGSGKKTSGAGAKGSSKKATTGRRAPKKSLPMAPKSTGGRKGTGRRKPKVVKPGSARMAADAIAVGSAMDVSPRKRKKKAISWVEAGRTRDYFEFGGSGLRLEHTLCSARNEIRDGNSALGHFGVGEKVKVEWDIKIVQGTMASLGVLAATDKDLSDSKAKYQKLLNGFFCSDRKGYGYQARDGGLVHGGKYKRKYGDTFKTGDMVTVTLDLRSKTLGFSKNGTSQGVAYKNIPVGVYRLAVTLPKKWHKVEIIAVRMFEVAP